MQYSSPFEEFQKKYFSNIKNRIFSGYRTEVILDYFLSRDGIMTPGLDYLYHTRKLLFHMLHMHVNMHPFE